VDYFLPAIIGAFIMTNGIIGVTTNTTEFKRNGVLRRFATTPLTRLDWVVGNVISQTILSFMLVIVMFVIAWLVFDLQAAPNLLTLVYVVVGAVLFSGIGLILSGLVKDVEAASAAGNAVAFPMMFLSGTFWSPEIMPAYLQEVARYLPLTYFSNGLRAAFILEHLPSALANLMVLVGMAAVCIIIGSLVTKWQE
jgi:ABC-2 type transport system permease protein